MTTSSAPAPPIPQRAAVPRDTRVDCEHAVRCGGCPAISLSYGEQLDAKRSRLVRAWSRYPSLALGNTPSVIPADEVVGYRTRAKLVVGPSGEVGLFAKGGEHEVLDIPGCRVLAPALSHVAQSLRLRIRADHATGGALAPFGERGNGSVVAVDLREARHENGAKVLVTLVVDGGRMQDPANLEAVAADLMSAEPTIAGVAANVHAGHSPQILGPKTVRLAGVDAAPDRIGDSVHHATFGSFVQAHRSQTAKVHERIAAAIEGVAPGGSPRVLDLYGGSGSIALALAARGARVHLVESFAPAAARAREAAQSTNLDVEAECGDVAVALRRLSEEREPFDAAVLNPPRRGASPAAREWLARLEPKVVVYVSCEPDTLARDLDHMTRLGFVVASIQPIDMMPLTDSVETVAVLSLAAPPPARVLYEDDQVLLVEKGAHEPTTPQGEYAGSLLARVRRIPSAREAVPVHRLDLGTGGLVVFAKRPAWVSAWARVLSADTTRKVYLAGVRGIAPAKGTIRRAIRDGSKKYAACTHYRRLAVLAGHSVLRVMPQQGRRHQIRIHLASVGHPILGDDRYGDAATNRHFLEKHGLDRTFLHCVRLEFDHPSTGARHVVEAPLGGDLQAVLERLGGDVNCLG